MIHTIAFDADDTLWHNEDLFQLTHAKFVDILAQYIPEKLLMEDALTHHLLAAERENIGRYGYGVKGFVLSMIEVALQVTQNRVPGDVIKQLIDAGHAMLSHPLELLPNVYDTITSLKDRYQLVLITKGDLLDQERKLAQSGLGGFFDDVHIVSEKTAQTYTDIFHYPERSIMVGNSLKSDVLPALGAGAWAMYIPYKVTWELEKAAAPLGHEKFITATKISDILTWVGRVQML